MVLGPLDTLKNWINTKDSRMMRYPHFQVHQGAVYEADFIATGTLDGGQENLYLFNPSGIGNKAAHVTMHGAVGGRAYLFFYEDATILASGTQLPIHNLNRTVAPTNEWEALQGVGVDNLGEEISSKFIPGSAGATPNAALAGQDTRGGGLYEWILDPQYGYLVVIFNDSGATVPVGVDVDWYEHDLITPV